MVAPSSHALDRLLAPVAECLTPDSAKRLAALQFSGDIRSHIESLAQKANEGTISEAERAEDLDYVEAMDLIGILQSKARQIVVRNMSFLCNADKRFNLTIQVSPVEVVRCLEVQPKLG